MTLNALRHVVDAAKGAELLGEQGWFVCDGFLGVELARRVRDEAPRVQLRPAGIRKAGAIDLDVRSDQIAWLTAAEATGALREAVGAFTTLRDVLNESAFLGLRSFDLQLARYEAGAKYVRHRDAFSGRENRRVTAIVYLNEGWSERDGGQLELLVEPQSVRVEPVLDRLVVFLSERIEHQVLEAHAERWALTAWYSAQP